MFNLNYKADREKWDQFITSNNGSFLQSFEWGEFQTAISNEVIRVGLEENGVVLAQVQIIKQNLPLFRNGFFYIPFGPCFKKGISKDKKFEIVRLFVKEMSGMAKARKAFFLRVEPFFDFPDNFKFLLFSKRVQPQMTVVLDIQREPEEIFKSFSHGLKYNIKFAEKQGVKIEKLNEYDKSFYFLLKKTSEEDNFAIYPEQYFKTLSRIKTKNFLPVIYNARYQNKVVASYFLLFFNKTVYSLYGGADSNFKKLKPQSLLHWHAIKDAGKMNFEKYDFWGIDQKKWPGITYFKKSFGGEIVSYPKGGDISFDNLWYKIYKSLRLCKSLLRKF